MLRIKDWDKHFEVAQTRRLSGGLNWIALPTKHDGKGFKRVMRAGPLHYAAWVLLVQVAAKCPKRGTLADSDGPLSAADIAIKTEFPEKHILSAIPILISVGWLEDIAEKRDTTTLGGHSEGTPSTVGEHSESSIPTVQYSTVQDITVQDSNSMSAAADAPAAKTAENEFIAAWNAIGKPFAQIAHWTPRRHASLSSRLAERFFRENWKAALARMKASAFCRGDSERGWIADVDWFLRPGTAEKIIEGKYDGKRAGLCDASTGSSTRAGEKPNGELRF